MGFAIIKLKEGDFVIDGNPPSIFPKPKFAWTLAHQSAVIPLYFTLSVGWALEMSVSPFDLPIPTIAFLLT